MELRTKLRCPLESTRVKRPPYCGFGAAATVRVAAQAWGGLQQSRNVHDKAGTRYTSSGAGLVQKCEAVPGGCDQIPNFARVVSIAAGKDSEGHGHVL